MTELHEALLHGETQALEELKQIRDELCSPYDGLTEGRHFLIDTLITIQEAKVSALKGTMPDVQLPSA